MYALLLLAAVTIVVIGATTAEHEYHSEPRIGLRAGPRRPTVDPAEQSTQYWLDQAQAAIDERLRRLENRNTARNVIMFLGDGLSVPTLAAARALLGQRQGHTGEEAELSFEKFPTIGLAKTYCVNAQIADSACTATAYLCGVKANRGTIGVAPTVPRWDCTAATDTDNHVKSIAEWALEDGRDAGIVTTTRITHASPSGAFAHTANRGWESDVDVMAACNPPLQEDIALQLVHSYPGNRFKVILGGGRREFLPNSTVDEEGTRGRRTDGRNLIEEWQNEKAARNLNYEYVWNREQLMKLSSSPPDYLFGLFEGSHMQYHMQANEDTEPTLAELTEVAIRSLSRNEKGFFLFVEGGRIDHAHHDNLVELALDETIEFSAAVSRATEMLNDEDTLIVITADHAHVMTYNGYTVRGGDILGPSDDIDEHGVPYMTLSYSNGPGFRPHQEGIRADVTVEESYRNAEWQSHVEVPLESETHGGDDVAVFALGPHHHLFTGLYEQHQLPHLMAYAACIGPGKHACNSGMLLRAVPLHLLLILFLLYRTLRL